MNEQTLPDALDAFTAVIASVSGIDKSEATALFNVNDRIFALNYVMTSAAELSELGTVQDLATLSSDILTPLIGMTNEIRTILAIANSAKNACLSEMSSAGTGTMFDGEIDTFSHCRIEFIPFYPYNNIPHIGYRVLLEGVKLKLDL